MMDPLPADAEPVKCTESESRSGLAEAFCRPAPAMINLFPPRLWAGARVRMKGVWIVRAGVEKENTKLVGKSPNWAISFGPPAAQFAGLSNKLSMAVPSHVLVPACARGAAHTQN